MSVLREAIGSWIHGRAEAGRALTMLLLFRPAAYLLPMAAIRVLARLVSVPLVLGFAQNRWIAREFANAYGRSLWGGLGLAVSSYASKFEEFALQQKYIAGIHRWGDPPIVIEANEEARRIMAQDGPLVLAQSHFVRNRAAASVLVPAIFGQRRVVAVTLRPPTQKFQPHAWRMRLQLAQILASSRAVRPDDFSFIYVGSAAYHASLIELRKPRTLLTINVDAHWRRGKPASITRPYAGALERTFATGAARLARESGAPLLLALPVHAADGHGIRMRVFGPYRSDLTDPLAHDAHVTHQMLDEIEREIGRRPTEYVLHIGGERRWDPATETWSRIAPPAAQAASGTESVQS